MSDVVANRPGPIREFDQIYMKSADILLQAEHISRVLSDKSVAFIGDGDAISLCLVHLHKLGHLNQGPSQVHVFDFDERIIHSVRRFARNYGYEDTIAATLYNVADPLPCGFLNRFDGFYTNPPYGASNEGKSIEAFVLRGIESTKEDATGCVVLADDDSLPWTHEVLISIQSYFLRKSFFVSELIPRFHTYHLDDHPTLTSCSMVVKRIRTDGLDATSTALDKSTLRDFYGKEAPLLVRYVRDRTAGGRLPSQDYRLEKL